MSNKPVVLAAKVIASTRLFQVEELHLCFANKQERYFERLRGRLGETVMIIPVLDKETVLLVREYGAGIEDYYLGFPKGAVNPNEDILAAANRELMEETGYGANKLTCLKSLSSNPSYAVRKARLVLATELFEHRLKGDEPESLEVVPCKLRDLVSFIEREDLHEAGSIAALYMVRDLLQRE